MISTVIGQNALSCTPTSASKCTPATGAVKELKLASPRMELHTGTPEGDRREQAPFLPFSWGSRGSKSARFKCNDLFSNC